MGIHNLKKILHEEDAIKFYPSYESFYKKIFYPKIVYIGIDFNLYYYKYQAVSDNIYKCFMNQIINLIQCRSIPIYIFDSTPSRIKQYNKSKKKYGNKYIPYLNFKCFFDLLQIQYYQSKEEGDALAGVLYQNKIIDCALTNDVGDYICYGCDHVIEIKNDGVMEYNYHIIENKLNFISKDEFVIFCILLGCDYFKNHLIMKHKYREIFYIFRNSPPFKSIDEYILQIFRIYKIYGMKKDNYMKIIDAFLLFTKNSNQKKKAPIFDHFSKIDINSILFYLKKNDEMKTIFNNIPFSYISLINKYKLINSR